jgi:hypothetical protein
MEAATGDLFWIEDATGPAWGIGRIWRICESLTELEGLKSGWLTRGIQARSFRDANVNLLLPILPSKGLDLR